MPVSHRPTERGSEDPLAATVRRTATRPLRRGPEPRSLPARRSDQIDHPRRSRTPSTRRCATPPSVEKRNALLWEARFPAEPKIRSGRARPPEGSRTGPSRHPRSPPTAVIRRSSRRVVRRLPEGSGLPTRRRSRPEGPYQGRWVPWLVAAVGRPPTAAVMLRPTRGGAPQHHLRVRLRIAPQPTRRELGIELPVPLSRPRALPPTRRPAVSPHPGASAETGGTRTNPNSRPASRRTRAARENPTVRPEGRCAGTAGDPMSTTLPPTTSDPR